MHAYVYVCAHSSGSCGSGYARVSTLYIYMYISVCTTVPVHFFCMCVHASLKVLNGRVLLYNSHSIYYSVFLLSL